MCIDNNTDDNDDNENILLLFKCDEDRNVLVLRGFSYASVRAGAVGVGKPRLLLLLLVSLLVGIFLLTC